MKKTSLILVSLLALASALTAAPPSYTLSSVILQSGTNKLTLTNAAGTLEVNGSAFVVGVTTNNNTGHFSNGILTSNNGSGILYDYLGTNSINLGIRVLDDATNHAALNWNTRQLYYFNGATAASWGNGLLSDLNGTKSVDWQNRALYDNSGTVVLFQWANQQMYDASQNPSIYWSTRILFNTNSATAATWKDYFRVNGAATTNLVLSGGATLYITNGIIYKVQ
jgi:hypothetical protein